MPLTYILLLIVLPVFGMSPNVTTTIAFESGVMKRLCFSVQRGICSPSRKRNSCLYFIPQQCYLFVIDGKAIRKQSFTFKKKHGYIALTNHSKTCPFRWKVRHTKSRKKVNFHRYNRWTESKSHQKVFQLHVAVHYLAWLYQIAARYPVR